MQQCKAVADQDVQLAEPLGRGPSSPPAVTQIALGVTAGETGEVVLSSRGRGTERVQCPSCQEPVAIWAAFCPHCGASLNESTQDSTPDSAPDVEAAASPDSSLTSELFGGEPTAPTTPSPTSPAADAVSPAASAAGAPGTIAAGTEAGAAAAEAPARPSEDPRSHDDHPAPATAGAAAAGEHPAYATAEPTEPKRASGATALMVAAAAIVAAALMFAAWSILRVGGTDDASNAPTGTTTTSPRPSVSVSPDAASSAAASPSATPSPSASASASVEGAVPQGSIACGVTGSGDTAAVYAGHPNTSCPFAQEVATAYRAAGASGGSVQVTAHSPVTGKDYTLTCTGTLPTTCVADTGATVYLTNG